MISVLRLAMIGITLGLSIGMFVSDVAGDTQESFVYDSKDQRDPFIPLVRNGRLIGVISSKKG